MGSSMPEKTAKDLIAENEELRVQLEEAQETLNAIRRGEVDGLVVSTPKGEQIYTLSGAETPYRLLIEEMKEGALMLSDDNIILYANKGFAKIVKHPLVEIVGKNIEMVIAPIHLSTFKEILNLSRSRKEVVENQIALKAKDNSLVPVHVSVALLTKNDPKTTLLIATDLTQHMEEQLKNYTLNLEKEIIERKKVENSLRESEQRWATTLSSIGDAVIAIDTFGKVSFMNKVAEKATGWLLSEALYKPINEIFNIINEQTRLEVENPVIKVLEKGMIVGLANHTVLIRKDGSEIPIDDSGAPIKYKDGKTIGVVLVFRDITERKANEKKLEAYQSNLEKLVEERTKQLKDSERLAAIGQTASMVGHDIRNPLQAITGDLYLAREDLKEMPQNAKKRSMQESLDSIEENIFYINKIVSDLQDYTRKLVPTPEKISLKKLVENAFEGVNFPDKVQTQITIDENFVFNADPDFLKRSLTNLIVNAVQAMPNGGKLNVEAKQNYGKIIICVKDTGVGIPEVIRPNLFTPLFTTKSKGQGLGLAVVKRLVESMNGTITFESKEGNGTTFIITIPQTKQTQL
jgi:PAS domain S-box-containing protein